jgi:methylmalonyl-CoA/ethylmalonyl-CoA epimerase
LRLHHLGYLVQSISEFEQNALLGTKLKQIYDPVQKAELALYEGHGGPLLELVEPKQEDAFTHRALEKNGPGFHHLCYQVADSQTVEALAEEKLWIPIRGPLPATLFDQAFVYFFMDRNRQIVELLVDEES